MKEYIKNAHEPLSKFKEKLETRHDCIKKDHDPLTITKDTSDPFHRGKLEVKFKNMDMKISPHYSNQIVISSRNHPYMKLTPKHTHKHIEIQEHHR